MVQEEEIKEIAGISAIEAETKITEGSNPSDVSISDETKKETSIESSPASQEKKLSFSERFAAFKGKAVSMAEKTGDFKDKAMSFGTKAYETTMSLTGKAKDMVEKTQEKIEEVKEKGEEMKEKMADAKDAAEQKMEEMKEKKDEIMDKAKDTVDTMKEKTSEMKDAFSGKTEEAAEIKEEPKENVEVTASAEATMPENAPEKPNGTNTSEASTAPSFKEKGLSFFAKAKEMATKTIETTSGLIEKTIPYMKTLEEYEKIKEDKILAILFIKKDEDESKKFLTKMPLIMKDVWINGATFKVVDIIESEELSKNFDFTNVPALYIYEKGEEKKKTEDIEEIKKYLKDFII